MRRLALLDSRGELTSGHVRLTATAVGVSERTVWRWVNHARAQVKPAERAKFEIDDRLRVRLAYHRGNAAALHRELVAERPAGGPAVPTLKTVQRAIRRDLSAGERAGLRRGERERRKFDVFLQRPISYRNAAWETDHVEAPVEVEVGGRLVKPWVTWFVDACHNAIAGTAVTPGTPSRESILAALRAAILRTEPYGPVGGLPALVRIDQGKDFLSRTVSEALGAFAVRVVPLPGYTPHLKGTVETVNGAAERMLFAGLPRYTHAQTLASGAVADPDAPALTFEAFTAEVLAWVTWWNTEHPMDELDGLAPTASWLADPSPVEDVDADALWMFTLEDDRKTRKITGRGVARGRGRHYVAEWMVGKVGTAVRLRYMPHHEHEVEVFDAATGAHLGSATLADQASPEQIAALRRTRAAKARQLRADLSAAEKSRRGRYAAATTPAPARRLDAVTAAEAGAELAEHGLEELARLARPDLLPPSPPPAGWVLPVDLDRITETSTSTGSAGAASGGKEPA
ncbi:Mu transposase C-terminal domain-containing protein [Amycolatopsis sp. lyj-23]|uniref:Mu transposase C-terminal domain-containing protein n=1 Tax=Amycolatopsis sp. lyj-23 TaxID=2789283 RepID=UPI00397C2E16